ncbi:hypothetical protein K9O30_07860 [Clostridium bowmanii]|uniref:hypothetical protein n=1 Tax=Clostridium bowmanii TaxID=132925 RepID=UPI001C0C1177|nr:hypothetical protein [Clostridium bowmanii]MBU3188948.1 hypothetical protein [Clostridium bowmanii]MCA1073643.1 hypothetical protein [Clostridium bowmanii]
MTGQDIMIMFTVGVLILGFAYFTFVFPKKIEKEEREKEEREKEERQKKANKK